MTRRHTLLPLSLILALSSGLPATPQVQGRTQEARIACTRFLAGFERGLRDAVPRLERAEAAGVGEPERSRLLGRLLGETQRSGDLTRMLECLRGETRR